LHKNDIIETEALFAWEKDKKKESTSKVAALEDVTSFLKSLKA
jgi:hypothetical protein